MSVKDIILAAAGAAAGAGGESVDTDPYFANTTLLLQGDVSNPDLSYNAFSDASGNERNITPNGDAIGSSFSPYNSSWSVDFANSGVIEIDDDSVFQFAGDFTINCFVYIKDFSSRSGLCCLGTGTTSTNSFQITIETNQKINFTTGSAADEVSTNTLEANRWYYLSFVRVSTTLSIYIDAVLDSTHTLSQAFTVADAYIGRNRGGAAKFNGYISNFQAINGIGTAPTSVPTSPLTDVTNTSLLTCQSNRFVDNSSTPSTFTLTGTLSVKSFAPFIDTDTTTGSGYFDGTDDYLSTPSNDALSMGTNNFTVNMWVYPTVDTRGDVLLDNYWDPATSAWQIYTNASTGAVEVYNANGGGSNIIIGGGVLTTGVWTYLSVVKSGTTVTIYLNAVSTGSGTANVTFGRTASNYVGSQLGSGNFFTGYISNVQVIKNSAIVPSGVPTSPATSDANTSLLTLQTRGAVRNIGFRDESEYNHLITNVGNCSQGTFSPFSQEEGKWSNYFSSTNDVIIIPDNDAWAFGADDFTIEAFFNVENTIGSAIFSQWPSSGTSNRGIRIYVVPSTQTIQFSWVFSGSTGTQSIEGTGLSGFTTYTWHHVAVTRSGSTLRLFFNGNEIDSRDISTTALNNSDQDLAIGRNTASSSTYFQGYISNLRFIKGTALYTTSFTPPTTPLTAVSGTSLLTCQSNRFVDNSINDLVLTPVNAVQVTPFSPFAPSAAYDPDVNGGSGYFDGENTTYLTDIGSVSDFNFVHNTSGLATIEAWIYRTVDTTAVRVIAMNNRNTSNIGFQLVVFESKLSFRIVKGTSGNVCVEWDYVSDAGTMYINGEVDTTFTAGSTPFSDSNATATLRIGNNTQEADGFSWDGYISNLRICNSIVYGGALTPPTAPLTPTSQSATNCELLCNFTNAGVIDATGRNVIETVGNAHVETSVKKYGTGSMEFDGTGDYLLLRPSQQLIFEGDFTIEFWSYITLASSTYHSPIGNYHGNVTTSWQIEIQNTGVIRLYYNGSSSPIVSSSGVITNETWQHIAAVRSGSTLALYVNGSQIGTASFSGALGNTTTNTLIASVPQTDSQELVGFIDDLRITKGVARYTTTFTPPTKSLPNQ